MLVLRVRGYDEHATLPDSPRSNFVSHANRRAFPESSINVLVKQFD